jgi:hypothetical protein
MKARQIESNNEPKTDLRVNPENRVCPQFDSTGIAKFSRADRGEMGVRVLDDCAFEHIM